jgi:hypothetical protein
MYAAFRMLTKCASPHHIQIQHRSFTPASVASLALTRETFRRIISLYVQGSQTNLSMDLSTGILIIGSLAWDTKGGRPNWRAKRLKEGGKISCKVKVPIRYGRLSNAKAKKPGLGTYTMVFADSTDCPLGDAKVFPCTAPVSNFDDLWLEARWLWAAETKGANDEPGAAVASPWGGVALLWNPALQNDSPKTTLEQALRKEWAKRVTKQRHYFDDREARLLTQEGTLNLDWPQFDVSGCSGFPDLLLATTNTPCLAEQGQPCFPSVNTIVLAWYNDVPTAPLENRDPYVGYFWCNYHNGFRTFQDEDIKQGLNGLAGAIGDPGKCIPPESHKTANQV